jgi:hypothetical protein
MFYKYEQSDVLLKKQRRYQSYCERRVSGITFKMYDFRGVGQGMNQTYLYINIYVKPCQCRNTDYWADDTLGVASIQ